MNWIRLNKLWKAFYRLQRAFRSTACGRDVLCPPAWDTPAALRWILQSIVNWAFQNPPAERVLFFFIVNTHFVDFLPKIHNQHLDVFSFRARKLVMTFKKVYNQRPVCQYTIAQLIVREASVIETQQRLISEIISLHIYQGTNAMSPTGLHL